MPLVRLGKLVDRPMEPEPLEDRIVLLQHCSQQGRPCHAAVRTLAAVGHDADSRPKRGIASILATELLRLPKRRMDGLMRKT